MKECGDAGGPRRLGPVLFTNEDHIEAPPKDIVMEDRAEESDGGEDSSPESDDEGEGAPAASPSPHPAPPAPPPPPPVAKRQASPTHAATAEEGREEKRARRKSRSKAPRVSKEPREARSIGPRPN